MTGFAGLFAQVRGLVFVDCINRTVILMLILPRILCSLDHLGEQDLSNTGASRYAQNTLTVVDELKGQESIPTWLYDCVENRQSFVYMFNVGRQNSQFDDTLDLKIPR
jgi:hypothetical protein